MSRASTGSAAANHREPWVVAVVIALLTILVSPDLQRSYLQINAFDEARYVESGRLLLAGELRNLTWGPLVALVYAPLHLVLGRSPDWFVLEASLGRLILYLGLLFSTRFLSLRLGNVIGRYAVLGVLFISTGFLGLLNNPSDALLVALSALSLGKIIDFLNRGREADLALASGLLGLAVLCRFESIVLFSALILAAAFNRPRLLSPWRSLLISILPAAVILGAYILAFRLTSPGADLGIGPKSYDSFEVNQPIPGPGTRDDRRVYARELFGTAAENRGSVLIAIRRNPAAFAGRLIANLGRLPDLYLDALGRRLGPAILLFAVWGGFSLLRTQKPAVILMLALWGMAPLVSLAFLPLHIIRQMSAVIHVLCAVGVTSALSHSPSRYARWGPIFAMLLLTAYGLADEKLALVVAGVVLASAFGLIRLTNPAGVGNSTVLLRGSIPLLAAGLILRGSYPFPDYAPVGGSSQEAVIHYLQQALPVETRILESLPLPAVAAKMVDVSWNAVPDLATSAEFHAWLEARGIQAVFVDRRDVPSPELVDLLEAGVGSDFEIGHSSEDGELRVFLPRSQNGD